MLGFFIWVYLTLFLIRPQEYLPALEGMPVVRIALLATFATWILRKKSLQAPTYWLMAGFAIFAPLSLLLVGGL